MSFIFLCFIACTSASKTDTGSGSSATDPTLFDQSCSVDDDCMPVKAGNLCGCNCTFDAINVAEEEAWEEHYAERKNNCNADYYADCAACLSYEAICVDGICEAIEATE